MQCVENADSVRTNSNSRTDFCLIRAALVNCHVVFLTKDTTCESPSEATTNDYNAQPLLVLRRHTVHVLENQLKSQRPHDMGEADTIAYVYL